MKTFTIDEANALLPSVEKKLKGLQKFYRWVDELRDQAHAAATASEKGGGMEGGTDYVKWLYEIGRITTEIHQDGIQLKDHSRGLIDFPSMRNGRLILLCWQLGEGDKIEWWHDPEAGFAGRQPL